MVSNDLGIDVELLYERPISYTRVDLHLHLQFVIVNRRRTVTVGLILGTGIIGVKLLIPTLPCIRLRIFRPTL